MKIDMIWRACFFTSLLFFQAKFCSGQRPLVEGRLLYQVIARQEGKPNIIGTFEYTFKDNFLKKEIILKEYHEVLIINTNNNTAYSLRTIGTKKYAIQLSIDAIEKDQQQFAGYTLSQIGAKTRKIAGLNAVKALIQYPNGTENERFYSPDWYLPSRLVFDRFPDAKFIPLNFVYKDGNGLSMEFLATDMKSTPIDNSIFVLPNSYKIISYDEYNRIIK